MSGCSGPSTSSQIYSVFLCAPSTSSCLPWLSQTVPKLLYDVATAGFSGPSTLSWISSALMYFPSDDKNHPSTPWLIIARLALYSKFLP